MHLHILGIGGTFMGGLAQLAKASGHRVTGCDAAVYPPMSDQLRLAGIDLIEGFAADQLALRPDCFVVGNVITRGNPLMEAVLDGGARFISGPQWLHENVLRGRDVLAVAGTHGKTTTASMLAWILQHAGAAPGFLIGGVPLDFGTSARIGEGAIFVIEADEYDTAFFDKRSKFVHYFPRIAVLNNLEFDHADIFADLAAIETQFHHLIRCVRSNGRLIVNAADDALARVLQRGCWSPVDRFNAQDGWHAAGIEEGRVHEFDVVAGSTRHGRLQLPSAGEHNRCNAVAAIAAASAAGIAPERGLPGQGLLYRIYDIVGETLYQGPGAGQMPTASSVVADLIDLGVGRAQRTFAAANTTILRTTQARSRPRCRDCGAASPTPGRAPPALRPGCSPYSSRAPTRCAWVRCGRRWWTA